jgi:hypothetical protein
MLAVGLGGFAGIAHADDPRDVFGLKPKQAEAPLDCSDGRAFGCAKATDPLADDVPYSVRSALPASYLLSLPTADATQVGVAGYAMGAGPDTSLGGATILENRWTIDGAPADGTRTGFADTRVPLVFMDRLLVRAAGFAARDRVSTGGTIDAQLKRGTKTHELDVRVWLGWSAEPSRRPQLPLTYNVRTVVGTPGTETSASLVATGPLGEHSWYAAGLAGTLSRTHFAFRASTLVDADQDGIPDGVPGIVATSTVERDTRLAETSNLAFMARTGWDRGPHHLELSLVGNWFDDFFYRNNATLQASGVYGQNLVGDGIATWRSEWKDTRLRVQAAWHRSQRWEHASEPSADAKVQQLSAYVPATLAEDQPLANACFDVDMTMPVGDDLYPKIPNCPIPIGWFYSGGAGLLVDTTGDRPSLTADLAHRIGNHVVRAGATGEDTRLVTDSRFTGGEQIRSLFPGHLDERRFLDQDTPCSDTGPCTTVDVSEVAWRTRYTAAYVEDTWRAAPNIQVDGGVRWELMWVGSALHFSNQLAPRLGLAYDPLGGGRSRVWASMGRSYAMLPAGLGRTVLRRDRYVDVTTSPFGTSQSVETGAAFAVAPGIQPITQDELAAGAELSPVRTVRLSVWALGRWLRRGLDTTPDGFDNPGATGGLAASRATEQVGAEVATAPGGKLVLRIGYMYGHTEGSWTGAYDPVQGAVLYAGDAFDFTDRNLAGELPTSAGHRTYIGAVKSGRVGPVGLSFATRLTVASGRPRSVLGESDDGLIFLLPRGSLGRGPVLTQANMRLVATWYLRRPIDFVLDVFNVFDHRDATNVDEVYSSGSIHPIVNGTASDLVFLRTDAGAPATRSAGFLVPTAYQAPVSVVLGVRTAF